MWYVLVLYSIERFYGDASYKQFLAYECWLLVEPFISVKRFVNRNEDRTIITITKG